MKIRITQIPPQGNLILEEQVIAPALDLETDTVRFSGPINIKAEVSKITNAVTVNLFLSAEMSLRCGRCLSEFTLKLDKKLKLNYGLDKHQQEIGASVVSLDFARDARVNAEQGQAIDLGPDIREEIILDYPIQPLCKDSCLGLCPKCGKNLNEGGCNCAPA